MKKFIYIAIGFQIGCVAQASFDRHQVRKKASELVEAEAKKKAANVHNMHVDNLEKAVSAYSTAVANYVGGVLTRENFVDETDIVLDEMQERLDIIEMEVLL